MIFSLIQKRTSVRTFRQEPLSIKDREWIQDIINSINKQSGPNGNSFAFKLLNPSPNGDGNIAGTYGFIQNARSYITGSSHNDEKAIEDYGICLRK